MPKAQRIRETTNPLGKKINEVMAEKRMSGDYAALAQVFGVATPSTYDWISHGRLGKERYQRLVEWSGKSLDWWFDIDAAWIGNDSGITPTRQLHDAAAPEYENRRRSRWPFSVPEEDINALAKEDIVMIDAYIHGVIDSRRNDARKRS